MTDNVRQYPNISFVDTDTETLVNALIRSYERFTGRTLYPADPARLFILWIAEPEAARTKIKFTLSMERDTATVIPAGTRLSAGEEIVFATAEPLIIPAGSLTGEVAAVCQTTGEIGNGFIPGQITKLVDIFPYFQKAENTTESAGGADWESDAAFYARIRESMETFSTAGPLGGYEYHAKSASALIVDVKATSPEPGEVDVRVLLAGGELPGEETLKAVSGVLNADKVRPLTDHVTVAAPETVPYDIDFT